MKNLLTQTDLYRRQFLQLLAAGAGVAASSMTGVAASGAGDASPAERSLNELLELTASEAIAAMRAGDLRAEIYAAVLLTRARSLRRLNALLSHSTSN